MLRKERCDIMHNETNCTYQDRQQQEVFNLCKYLRARKHVLPENDHDFLNKESSIFFRAPIESVLNWETRIIIGLSPTNENKKRRTRDIRSYMVEIGNKTTTLVQTRQPADKKIQSMLQSRLTLIPSFDDHAHFHFHHSIVHSLHRKNKKPIMIHSNYYLHRDHYLEINRTLQQILLLQPTIVSFPLSGKICQCLKDVT